MQSTPEPNPWLSAITQAITRSEPPEYALDQWFNAWQGNTPRTTSQPELYKGGEGTSVQVGHKTHPEDPARRDGPDLPGTKGLKPSVNPSEPVVTSSEPAFIPSEPVVVSPSPPPSPVVINFGLSQPSESPRVPPIVDFGTPDSATPVIEFGSPMESPQSPPLIDFDSPGPSPRETPIIDFGSPIEDAQSALHAVMIRSPITEPRSPPLIDFPSPSLSPRTPNEMDFDWHMDSPSSQVVVDFGQEADGPQSKGLPPVNNHPSPMDMLERPLSPLAMDPGSPIDIDFGSLTPPHAKDKLSEATESASSGMGGIPPPDNMLGDFQIPDFLLFAPNEREVPVTDPAVFPYEQEKAQVIANLVPSAPAIPRGSAPTVHPDFLGTGPDVTPDANIAPLMGYSPNIHAATRYGYTTVPGKRILPSFVGVIVSQISTRTIGPILNENFRMSPRMCLSRRRNQLLHIPRSMDVHPMKAWSS